MGTIILCSGARWMVFVCALSLAAGRERFLLVANRHRRYAGTGGRSRRRSPCGRFFVQHRTMIEACRCGGIYRF
uniref:Putative secreted protein n=1 Tax=Anopheles marajoara TaxID=58244 RepID=A0A2M4CDR5_9DIPT